MRINQYAKAIMAGLVAGYAMFQVATGTGSPLGETVSANEWVGIAVSVLIAAGAVWAVPNAPASKPPTDPEG